jgi:hypothetical protein
MGLTWEGLQCAPKMVCAGIAICGMEGQRSLDDRPDAFGNAAVDAVAGYQWVGYTLVGRLLTLIGGYRTLAGQ